MICLVLKIASEELTRVLQEENAFSELLVQILAVRSTRTQADLIDQLFNNSEPRPARTLLLMADDGNESGPVTLIPPVTHADMIGITRSRVSFFMNWFRKLGHISYKDHIRVHKSLLMMGFLRIGCRSRTRHVLSSPISESVGHESPSEPRSSGSRSPRINSRTQRTIHRFCAVFFGASVLSVTIVTIIWKMMYLPDIGLISRVTGLIGIAPIPFLTSQSLALPAIAVTTVWWIIGLPMMLFLAALQQIPGELYEAAALDNAGRWRSLWSITLPSIRRTLVVVVIYEIVAQFQLFGQTWLLTRGGPNNTSRSIVLFIYETGFRDWDLGYAAAASEILFLLMAIAAMAQYLASRRREV